MVPSAWAHPAALDLASNDAQMAALKSLGLNIKKMSMECSTESCSLEKVFYVTDAKTSEKVCVL
jgi:hypothetical protein